MTTIAESLTYTQTAGYSVPVAVLLKYELLDKSDDANILAMGNDNGTYGLTMGGTLLWISTSGSGYSAGWQINDNRIGLSDFLAGTIVRAVIPSDNDSAWNGVFAGSDIAQVITPIDGNEIITTYKFRTEITTIPDTGYNAIKEIMKTWTGWTASGEGYDVLDFMATRVDGEDFFGDLTAIRVQGLNGDVYAIFDGYTPLWASESFSYGAIEMVEGWQNLTDSTRTTQGYGYGELTSTTTPNWNGVILGKYESQSQDLTPFEINDTFTEVQLTSWTNSAIIQYFPDGSGNVTELVAQTPNGQYAIIQLQWYMDGSGRRRTITPGVIGKNGEILWDEINGWASSWSNEYGNWDADSHKLYSNVGTCTVSSFTGMQGKTGNGYLYGKVTE